MLPNAKARTKIEPTMLDVDKYVQGDVVDPGDVDIKEQMLSQFLNCLTRSFNTKNTKRFCAEKLSFSVDLGKASSITFVPPISPLIHGSIKNSE